MSSNIESTKFSVAEELELKKNNLLERGIFLTPKRDFWEKLEINSAKLIVIAVIIKLGGYFSDNLIRRFENTIGKYIKLIVHSPYKFLISEKPEELKKFYFSKTITCECKKTAHSFLSKVRPLGGSMIDNTFGANLSNHLYIFSGKANQKHLIINYDLIHWILKNNGHIIMAFDEEIIEIVGHLFDHNARIYCIDPSTSLDYLKHKDFIEDNNLFQLYQWLKLKIALQEYPDIDKFQFLHRIRLDIEYPMHQYLYNDINFLLSKEAFDNTIVGDSDKIFTFTKANVKIISKFFDYMLSCVGKDFYQPFLIESDSFRASDRRAFRWKSFTYFKKLIPTLTDLNNLSSDEFYKAIASTNYLERHNNLIKSGDDYTDDDLLCLGLGLELPSEGLFSKYLNSYGIKFLYSYGCAGVIMR